MSGPLARDGGVRQARRGAVVRRGLARRVGVGRLRVGRVREGERVRARLCVQKLLSQEMVNGRRRDRTHGGALLKIAFKDRVVVVNASLDLPVEQGWRGSSILVMLR